MEFCLSKNTALEPHDKHWQFSVGSCHAPLAHRVDYLEQLKFIHDELGIERVRFHGLFNDDMKVGLTLKNFIPLPSAAKYKQFSFFQIAKIYDNILKTGMRPFVELGFMPKILASGKRNCMFQYKGNITMPKSLDEWAGFIRSFIEFLIDRYGRDEVKTWYFEVWNEPNLKPFFAGSQQDYFKLYEATARAIKSVEPDIRVGGPATANCVWIEDFKSFCDKNNVPVDFISTHQYAGDPIGHVMKTSAMLKAILKRIADLRKGSGTVLEGARKMLVDGSESIEDRNVFMKNLRRVKKEADGLPVLYTEWNVSATCTAPINDTRRAASYAIRTVLHSENTIDKSSLWCFSDLFEEIEFFPEPFSGAFGMIDVYGIPKPSFYAFKILSMLGGQRFNLPVDDTADVEFAAFKKDNITQLLLYRQNFKAEKGDAVKFTVSAESDARPNNVFLYRIDDDHCNPLKEWEALGKPEYLKPDEVEKIKKASSLVREQLPFTYADGKFTAECALYNNDVWLIEVE